MRRLFICLFLLLASRLTAQTIIEGHQHRYFAGQGTNTASFFQDSRMNNYNIKHLKLDLTIQPKSKFITGSCSYAVQFMQAADSFVIEFKDNMTLDSVLVNNRMAAFTHSNDHIRVLLSSAAAASDVVNLTFYYHGNVVNGFFSGTDANGLSYTANVSESFQAREWFPAKQLLNDKIDSTDIWITTGADYKAGSNGLLKAVIDLPGNRKQYRWSCRYPLSYYMPSVAVGNYLEYDNYAKPVAIVPDSILVQNLLVNDSAYFQANKYRLDKTPLFIEKMSELFGIYPFYKEKYGHSQAAIGGGMEHATMTTLQNFEENLVAHELGHQWFGDNVTCASWSDIWLNESFATYIQILMHEKLPALFSNTAAQAMTDLHNNAMSLPGGSVYVPVESAYDESRIFNYRLTYAKGATTLHNLRFDMQSDSLFFNTLKAYQQKFANSFASTTDFKQVAEQVSGKKLDDFFNQKIYGEGYPTYNVTYSKRYDTLVLAISQTASEPSVTPFFNGLMEYKILSAAGDTTLLVNQTSAEQTFKFFFTRAPAGVVVDPNNWVLNKTGTITAGESMLPTTDVKVFPNPVTNSFSAVLPADSYKGINVFDMQGRLLARYSIPGGTTIFTRSLHLPGGVYFLHFFGAQKKAVRKIVVK